MADYRLYLLNRQGRISRAMPLACNSDEQAVETVFAYPHLHGMELWQQDRFVRGFEAKQPNADAGADPAARATASNLARGLFEGDPRR